MHSGAVRAVPHHPGGLRRVPGAEAAERRAPADGGGGLHRAAAVDPLALPDRLPAARGQVYPAGLVPAPTPPASRTWPASGTRIAAARSSCAARSTGRPAPSSPTSSKRPSSPAGSSRRTTPRRGERGSDAVARRPAGEVGALRRVRERGAADAGARPRGLDLTGVRFLWALREAGSKLLPDGFEARVAGRGVVRVGWARS
jgi:hypothetical protein